MVGYMDLGCGFGVKERLDGVPQEPEPLPGVDDEHTTQRLGVVVSVDLLEAADEVPCSLVEVLVPLRASNFASHTHLLQLQLQGDTMTMKKRRKQKKASMHGDAHHSGDVEDGGALVDVLLGADGACRELEGEGALELPDVVLDVAVHAGDLQQLGGVDLAQLLHVHRPAVLVHAVVPLRVVLQHLVHLLELEVLHTCIYIVVVFFIQRKDGEMRS
jgi:hypothetical protein